MKTNITITAEGSLVGLMPETAAARTWLDENVAAKPQIWIRGTLYVERRCADPILEEMIDDGLHPAISPANRRGR